MGHKLLFCLSVCLLLLEGLGVCLFVLFLKYSPPDSLALQKKTCYVCYEMCRFNSLGEFLETLGLAQLEEEDHWCMSEGWVPYPQPLLVSLRLLLDQYGVYSFLLPITRVAMISYYAHEVKKPWAEPYEPCTQNNPSHSNSHTRELEDSLDIVVDSCNLMETRGPPV